jgi:N-acetylneuraminic acid mutarotase
MTTGTLLTFFQPEAAAKASHPAAAGLTFAERVAYQRAIEDVYWRHRIWPKENSKPKPSLDEVMSVQRIEKKVEDYLCDAQVLEDYWQRPITPNQLQAELERIATHTKQPEVLRELFAALGNDSYIIAECLARPIVAQRLLKSAKEPQNPSKAMSQPINSRKADRALFGGYTLPRVPTTLNGTGACIDAWGATSTTNAPSARAYHTAIWTGSEMIVWGGWDGSINYLNTGAKYNPSTDSWTGTSIANAPSARLRQTAVWTGSEMVVWGGGDANGPSNTGGKYNPNMDSWVATATANAPAGRLLHTTVWTGSEMIVWGGGSGGSNFITGGRYNPTTDNWTATSTSSAPEARVTHTAVWSGDEMIIWGGASNSGYLNSGGRYNPGTDSWTATNTTSAPSARNSHTAVWAGNQMIVWGGGPDYFNTGGRYSPGTDSWVVTSTTNAPPGREFHTAIWTASDMIVWGGINNGSAINTGGRYNPATDTWTATDTTYTPSARSDHTAVWTASEMIVWGGKYFNGQNNQYLNTGGRYCGQYPTPTPTSTASPTLTPTPTPACAVTSPNCGTTVFSPPTDFIVQLSPPGPAGVEASDFTVNGIPANSFMIVSGGGMIHFYFNTSPAVQGQNTIHIAACAFFCINGCVPEFTCTFLYAPPTPTPTSTPTPTPTSTPRPTLTPRSRPTPAPRP